MSPCLEGALEARERPHENKTLLAGFLSDTKDWPTLATARGGELAHRRKADGRENHETPAWLALPWAHTLGLQEILDVFLGGFPGRSEVRQSEKRLQEEAEGLGREEFLNQAASSSRTPVSPPSWLGDSSATVTR
jgi:hypothetical protein